MFAIRSFFRNLSAKLEMPEGGFGSEKEKKTVSFPIFDLCFKANPMFDSPDYPKSLPESLFESWFDVGRSSKIPYSYLLIVWDEIEGRYIPVFAENRKEIEGFEKYGDSPARQLLVAAYDLYSESRVG